MEISLAREQRRFQDAVAAGADPYVGTIAMAKIRGISPRTLTRHVYELFLIPKPEKIGLRKVGWRLSIANKSAADLERIAKEQAGPEAVARLEAAEAARRKRRGRKSSATAPEAA
jgi:predicted DNA-binding transcriptional regulator AlpA